MSEQLPETIAQRVVAVQARVHAACQRSGRAADAVEIVAVTKTHGPDAVRAVQTAGLSVVGENRVQEAMEKQTYCPGDLHWHLVGHLQTNKARQAVRTFEMIHSIDSIRILQAVAEAAESEGVTIPVCLEVNVAGESSKWGLEPSAVMTVLEEATGLMNVDVIGLMTMPPFAPDPEEARPFFAQLRELRDDLRIASGFALETLSMGMSNDFEVAIEEGATLVRLGTALFGQRTGGRWRPSAEEDM